MGKRKQRNPPPRFATKGYGGSHFTPMFDDQLNSPAFIALSAVAVRVYLILRQEYKGAYTGNRVICPYDTFTEKGISRNSISKAIRMLEAMGFITCERGGLGHQPSIYRFSDRWAKIETLSEAKNILKKLKDTMEEKNKRSKLAKETIPKQINAL